MAKFAGNCTLHPAACLSDAQTNLSKPVLKPSDFEWCSSKGALWFSLVFIFDLNTLGLLTKTCHDILAIQGTHLLVYLLQYITSSAKYQDYPAYLPPHMGSLEQNISHLSSPYIGIFPNRPCSGQSCMKHIDTFTAYVLRF